MNGVGTHQFRQDLISLLFAHRMRREAAPSRSCTVHHDAVTGRRASCCEQRVACRPEQPGELVARLNRTLSHRAMRVFAHSTRYTCPIAFASPRERPPRLLSMRDPNHEPHNESASKEANPFSRRTGLGEITVRGY